MRKASIQGARGIDYKIVIDFSDGTQLLLIIESDSFGIGPADQLERLGGRQVVVDTYGDEISEMASRFRQSFDEQRFDELRDPPQTPHATRPAMSEKLDPPRIAEFLLTALATTRAAEAMIGDLNERFADEIQRLGRQRAVRLYRARTLRSLWPLLWRAIGKAVKWGALRWFI
jgi:hypothetical protein